MALFKVNATCDIYRTGVSPPAPPSVQGVKGFLLGRYTHRLERGEDKSAALRYTHTLLVEPTTDIRDTKATAFTASATPDIVYIPNNLGTPYRVVHVERRNQGTFADHKRVYLDRGAINVAAPGYPRFPNVSLS